MVDIYFLQKRRRPIRLTHIGFFMFAISLVKKDPPSIRAHKTRRNVNFTCFTVKKATFTGELFVAKMKTNTIIKN